MSEQNKKVPASLFKKEIETFSQSIRQQTRSAQHKVKQQSRLDQDDERDADHKIPVLGLMPEGKLVVAEGLEGYLVAEHDNVLLICKKDDQHAIRRFVNDVEMKFGEDYV